MTVYDAFCFTGFILMVFFGMAGIIILSNGGDDDTHDNVDTDRDNNI